MRQFSLVYLVVLLLAFSAHGAADQATASAASYRDVRAMLRELSEKYPDNARIVTLGMSDSGQPIEGIALGTGPTKNLVVATHHGNEYGSTEVAKAFARSVAEAPIQGQTVFVVPVLNIAGYDKRSRWEPAGGRSNDPNRDYPGPCGTEGPFRLKSTAALASFIEREGIVASATLHTHFPAVVYPWGFATRDLSTPYDDLFTMLSQAATVESRYRIGNSTKVIYPAAGTFEDYAFWKHGVWSLLFELGYSHNPSSEDIKRMVDVNIPGMRRMFAQAPLERAENHEFRGRCDYRLLALDRHDE